MLCSTSLVHIEMSLFFGSGATPILHRTIWHCYDLRHTQRVQNTLFLLATELVPASDSELGNTAVITTITASRRVLQLTFVEGFPSGFPVELP